MTAQVYRSVVFLQGCSLGYRWCQNPENHSPQQELLFDGRPCLTGCTLSSELYLHTIRPTDDLPLSLQHSLLFAADYAALTGCCPTGALNVCTSVIHFLPYHTLRTNKCHLLGTPYHTSRPPLSPELLAYAEDYASAKGLTITPARITP